MDSDKLAGCDAKPKNTTEKKTGQGVKLGIYVGTKKKYILEKFSSGISIRRQKSARTTLQNWGSGAYVLTFIV